MLMIQLKNQTSNSLPLCPFVLKNFLRGRGIDRLKIIKGLEFPLLGGMKDEG